MFFLLGQPYFPGKISEEAAKGEFPLWCEEVMDTAKEYVEVQAAPELLDISATHNARCLYGIA